MSRIGLVVEGGGMKCAYSSAILDKFLDDHINFDYVAAVSAGSGNAASYLAGQRNRSLRFYTTHVHEKGYFGIGSFLKTGDLFGLDYIYSTLTNSDGGDPLDYPKMRDNPADFEIVATNALTGKPQYFDKSRMHQDDYEVVKASCALPAACNPRVIDGVPYYDGGVSDPLPVDRALTHGGCDRVVVVMTKTRDFVRKPEKWKMFYHIRCRRYPIIVDRLDHRHITYTRDFRHVFDLERQGRVFVFCPSRDLHISTFTTDDKENMKFYDLGLEDYAAQKEALLQFMKG